MVFYFAVVGTTSEWTQARKEEKGLSRSPRVWCIVLSAFASRAAESGTRALVLPGIICWNGVCTGCPVHLYIFGSRIK